MSRAAVEPVVEWGPSRAVPRHAGGGPSGPRRAAPPVANGMLAMAVFIATEVMLFAGLVSAFIVLRAGAAWPPPDQPRLPVAVTGANTAILLLSAYTMHRSVEASRSGHRAAMLRLLSTTTILGATFLLIQGTEWVALIRHGLTMSSSLYGSTFYTLIGCHGLHVLAAVVALASVLSFGLRGDSASSTRRRLEVCRLYWSFVVAVWPPLYVLVYLA
jgi:heme/copper-type cytochrome/quinol oxidase subunit 3